MTTFVNCDSCSVFLCVLSLSHQVLKLELKEIREQQDLLFRFMNFLKQEGAVHVLQFCLAVGKLFEKDTALACMKNLIVKLKYEMLFKISFTA